MVIVTATRNIGNDTSLTFTVEYLAGIWDSGGSETPGLPLTLENYSKIKMNPRFCNSLWDLNGLLDGSAPLNFNYLCLLSPRMGNLDWVGRSKHSLNNLVLAWPLIGGVQNTISMITVGMTISENLRIRFGAVGPVFVNKLSDLKNLEMGVEAVMYFKPISAPLVVVFNQALSDEIILKALATVGQTSRTIFINPVSQSLQLDIVGPRLAESGVTVIWNYSDWGLDPTIEKSPVWWPTRSWLRTMKDVLHVSEAASDYGIKMSRSSGLFFKGDHSKYGGEGLKSRLSRIETLCPKLVEIDLNFDWTPPEVIKEQELKDIRLCHVCKNEIEYVSLEKFQFAYCSISCLSEHRKMNWASK